MPAQPTVLVGLPEWIHPRGWTRALSIDFDGGAPLVTATAGQDAGNPESSPFFPAGAGISLINRSADNGYAPLNRVNMAVGMLFQTLS
jgi:hypothetical protein